MRTLLALASVALLAGAGFGCGDDTTTTTVADMTAVADMTVTTPHDMTQFTCAQILTCAQGCSDAACQATCASEGTTMGKQLIGAFTTCLFETCGPGDGGNDSCTSLTDTSAGCATCLNNTAQAAAIGGGAPCSTEFHACATN